MNKLTLFAALFFMVAACNSKKEGDKKPEKSTADSLMDKVMDGHDAGMAKYGKMQGLKKQVDAALDSLSKLPAKAKEEAAPYQQKMQELSAELGTALADMDTWMESFNMDSALNNMEERIRYLTEEKDKVGRIKDMILQTVKKADSLLKK
jgi:hypothetical protein